MAHDGLEYVVRLPFILKQLISYVIAKLRE